MMTDRLVVAPYADLTTLLQDFEVEEAELFFWRTALFVIPNFFIQHLKYVPEYRHTTHMIASKNDKTLEQIAAWHSPEYDDSPEVGFEIIIAESKDSNGSNNSQLSQKEEEVPRVQ